MKGVLVLVAIVGAIVAWTQLDRIYGDRVRAAYDRAERWAFPAGVAVVFGGAAVLSFLFNAPKLELGFTVAYSAMMAMGLNVVVGYAGLLDLGYVAFFAIGAYTMAILSGAGPIHSIHLNFWLILPIGVAIALLSGFILGAPTLRLRGDYLAIVTLGFGEIVRILAENLEGITNGAKGISQIPRPGISLFKLFSFKFGVIERRPYLFLAMAFLVLFVFVIRSLNAGRVGRAWAAIREDEIAAEAMGVPTLKYKLWAFAIGAALASIGGMIFAAEITFVDPAQFQLIISIFILSMVVLGGIGSMAGAMAGAAIVVVVPEMLRSLPERLLDARFGIFGLALVVMMIFRPQGVVPSRRRAAELKGGAAETKGPLGAALPPEAEIAAGGRDTEEGV